MGNVVIRHLWEILKKKHPFGCISVKLPGGIFLCIANY